MKKLLIIATLLLGCFAVNAQTAYNIIGVYHDARENTPSTWRVVTSDNKVCGVKMTLLPAQVRARSYEVNATRVADNLYCIESKAFLAKLYIEVEECEEEASKRTITMVINNIKGDIKGQLIFE